MMTRRIRRFLYLRVLLGMMLGTAAVATTGCASSAAEGAAKAKLKELKAIISMDADQKHVTSVMISQNTDEAFPQLKDLAWLEVLNVSGTDFDDTDAANLKGLSALTSLDVANTQLSDEGLTQIARLPLTSLVLAHTKITAAGMETIGELSKLKVLELSGNDVQGNLLPLKRLSHLEWLVLREVDLSSISDEAIDTLIALPKLGRLTVTGTNLPKAAVEKIKTGKPGINLEAGEAVPTSSPGQPAAVNAIEPEAGTEDEAPSTP